MDELSRTLYLAVTDFVYESEARTISNTDRHAVLKRVVNLVKKARSASIEVEDHSPVVDLLLTIEEPGLYDTVHCYLLTNKVSSGEPLKDELVDDVPVSLKTWDLESIRRLRQTGQALAPIEVDFLNQFNEGVPFLRAPTETPNVNIYLAFLPGQFLASIYNEHGPRLLERNVRSFLMARGKINRGIRDTLRHEPENFLAFNNGITATASDVSFSDADGRERITGIKDLQVVNGGQTTASIGLAENDPEVDLSKVAVQLKLAVVEPALDELVPEISKYANRQNAVQAADLSANHPHLRTLQEVSRTEWTPSSGQGRATKWYFERARGSYAVEKSQAGTASEQKAFAAAYPPNQKFGKSEVALYELTWRSLPHLVCRGGQKSFAEYLERFATQPQADADEAVGVSDADRESFRDLVAKAILFKTTDKLVAGALGGTYKRPVVAYTAAYVLAKNPALLDLDLTWRTQQLSDQLQEAIGGLELKERLISSGHGRNITEWAKQEACWDVLRSSEFGDPSLFVTSGPAKKRAPQRKQNPPSGSGGTATLADCIEKALGEPIHGKWRRFRKPVWKYIGDSGVDASSGRGTLHVFIGAVKDEQGPYSLAATVDYAARKIIPMGHLPDPKRKALEAWIVEEAKIGGEVR